MGAATPISDCIAIADVGQEPPKIRLCQIFSDFTFCVVTAFVTDLDILVNIIINRLYIPIIYLLATQSIFLSICLSITRSVQCMYVGNAICVSVCVLSFCRIMCLAVYSSI